MKIAQELSRFFKSELSPFYEQKELDALFYWCIEHIFQMSRSQWMLSSELVPSKESLNRFYSIVNRLKKQEPIQYILGECEFYGLSFRVNPHCLIPRPETEELVRWVLDHPFDSALDIGTGSGCIAIALAKHSNATISALDISQEAIDLAKRNAQTNEVNVSFFQHDIFETLHSSPSYELIVSNPPYVLHSEKERMKANVLNYEPHLALFVKDSNPLVFYQRIIEFSNHHLSSKGLLFFEINEQKAPDLVNLLEKEGFSSVLIKKDMQGKNRMVKAQKKL